MKKFNRIKNILKTNNTIFANFTYLGILQFVRIIIPLIILPYLIRILGIEKYGIVIFAQTVVFYFMVVVNFGFEMSATKQVSINRNDKLKLSELVSAVVYIKTILLILSGLVFISITYFIPGAKNYFVLFLLSFLFSLQEIFIPIWFFQGIEKMKFITIIDVISRTIFLILIFLFIHKTEDYLLVPIFRFIGIIVAGAISVYLIFIKEKIKFIFISKRKLHYYFMDSLPFFYSKLSTVINDRTNTLLLGLSLGMTSVAYYDFVNKVIGAVNSIFGTFVRVLYPHISITKNLRKVKKILYFNVIMSSISYLLLSIFAKNIILLVVGEILLPAHTLFYILGLMLPLVAIGWSLGDLYLAAFGYSKVYSSSSIYSTILYLVIVGVLYIFSAINIYSLIFSLLIRLVFLDLYRYFYCKKYQLIE